MINQILLKLVNDLKAELELNRIPFNLHKPLQDAIQLLNEIVENAERIEINQLKPILYGKKDHIKDNGIFD